MTKNKALVTLGSIAAGLGAIEMAIRDTSTIFKIAWFIMAVMLGVFVIKVEDGEEDT